jgi:hypothetical protein
MEQNKYEISPIWNSGDNSNTLSGVKFTDPETGQEIKISVHFNYPGYITISGDSRIEIMPWATNMIRVRSTKD